MPTTVEAIEAAAIPTRPQGVGLRGEPQVTRTRAIRKLLREAGIKRAFVTSARGSMCFHSNVDFDGIVFEVRDRDDHRPSTCPTCCRNSAAVKKVEQIILAGFPDFDDRSDSMTDHSDFVFMVSVHRPESAPGPAELEAVATVKLGSAGQPPALAEPAHEEEPPEYVATPDQRRQDASGLGKFIGNAADVWTACRDLEAEDREHFVVFFMNVRHRMLGERWTCSIGSATGVEVTPREVYREALKRGAVSLVVAHNHPSGEPSPSRQDIELTGRIRQGGEMLGVALLDHVIIGTEGFVSLASRGWT